MKNLPKKVNETELKGVTLLLEAKLGRNEIKQLVYQNKILVQVTEIVLDVAVQEDGVSLSYVDRLLEKLKPRYVVLAVSVSRKFDA